LEFSLKLLFLDFYFICKLFNAYQFIYYIMILPFNLANLKYQLMPNCH